MNCKYEKNLVDKGYPLIAGLDEAGRGALAGPLIAAAVILNLENLEFAEEINDSKKLTAERREDLFPKIIKNSASWAVGVVSNKEIDQHGLSYANKIIMTRACEQLQVKPDYILVDYMSGVYFKTPFELIKQGDAKIMSIAAASIIAKVLRDRIMRAFARKYPEYGFEENFGYGTPTHMERIECFGACEIHRKHYKPLWPRLF